MSSATGSEEALRFTFLTLFPEMFAPVLDSSLLGKAKQRGLVSYALTQIRDYAKDQHRTVDDTPYGGGEGMVLKADVLAAAWKASGGERGNPDVCTIFLSPQGATFDQAMARRFASKKHLILVCGHYEGVDERFIDACVDEEVSIGDYVLTGGELPAMVMADTITRLIPSVVGNDRSLSEESFEKDGLLKYPQYTRPRDLTLPEGSFGVPEVLMSGNHGLIAKWRLEQMEKRTESKRPDIWTKYLDIKKNRKK